MRMLLVDPCSETRHSLSNALSLENDFVWIGQADNASEALAIISQERVDVVITELDMPCMDGFELLKRLAAGVFRRIKALVLTRHCEQGNVLRALSLGARYVMQKPMEHELIIRRVREIAGNSIHAPYINTLPAQSLFMQPMVLHEIETTLLALGLPANRLGFQYLRDAIIIALEHHDALKAPRELLYPEVARRGGTVASRVNRCVCRAVDLVWTRADAPAMRQSLGNPPAKGADWRFCGAFIGYFTSQMRRRMPMS